MTENPKKRKDSKFIERFLRLFPAYRELEKTIRHKNDVLNLSTAIIQSYRDALETGRKEIESDAALIESFNRYIEALEGKAGAQAELIQELKEKLNTLFAMQGSQKETPE